MSQLCKKQPKRRGRPLKQPPLKPLTPNERIVAGVIDRYWREHGRSPSVKEITFEAGLATMSNGYRYVKQLGRKGWLHWRRKGVHYGLLLVAELPPLPGQQNIRED